MTAPLLRTLDEIQGSDLPLVGGKAFNLATLRRRGLPVSPGLVVTTAFFEMQLRHHQFTPLWAGSPDVAVTEGALGWLSDALKTSPLARELMRALRERLAEVFPDTQSFAVRSSAVDEDARRHAFSGVHLTELGVPREMIPISLSRCWASALSKPALEYRRQCGISIQSIRLAVLIQPFIQPTASGVAFTINPVSGASDELIIEAAFGHGGRVAGGQITPARYRLAKRGPDYPVLDWTPGHTSPPPQRASPTGDSRGPLSVPHLRKLAQYLEHIEALMAAPQDVEWAITRQEPGVDEELIFFQTRPITVLPSATPPFDVEWSRANHREFLPDLPSPMCASLLERTQDRALSFLNELGFNLENTGPYLRIIYGRPYLNLTMARRLLGQSGLNPPGLLWIIGHAELPCDLEHTSGIDWRQAWAARLTTTRLLLRSLRARAWVSRFESLADEVRRSLLGTDWANPSPADLLTRFRLRTQLSSQMNQADSVLSAAAVMALAGLAQALGSFSHDISQLVREATEASTKAGGGRYGRMLLELARSAQAEEQVRHYLADPGDSFDHYRLALAGTSFLAAFDDFMVHHGHAATFESDPGWPRYSEDPALLLSTVAQIANTEALPDRQETSASRPHPSSMTSDHEQGSMRRWASLRSAEGLERIKPWRYWLARPVFRRLHRLARMRARLRDLYGRSMTDCRMWDLKLAERWVTRNWLVQPGDYYWLTMEEVERALMAEAEVGPALSALVSARRETYQTYAATEMPYTLRESDIARLVPGHGLGGPALSSVLSGLPISPGQVQGRVIVLRRPSDSVLMQEGAILVTPSTDTAWFPIFPQARGLIVETGGLLSHGSIIAREFGLPAVANIPHATDRFQDGDLVLLDGSTGLVQILDTTSGGSP